MAVAAWQLTVVELKDAGDATSAVVDEEAEEFVGGVAGHANA